MYKCISTDQMDGAYGETNEAAMTRLLVETIRNDCRRSRRSFHVHALSKPREQWISDAVLPGSGAINGR
jgi:hypothetical protein